jgi:sulfonate transport system substrate-binding protein
VNLLAVRQRALLDARLPGVAIKWVEFPAGPQLLEALAAGGIDFGFTGDSPPVFAQAAGREMVYVGVEPPKPASSAILVPADSTLKTGADLKGRRVGLQKGSSAHWLLVRAVAKAGLAWNDIAPVYLAPADARAAFERRALDAWAIWDPYYAAAEIEGRARVLSTGQGLTDNHSFYLAAPALTKRPAVLGALFAALSDADTWVRTHHSEAAHFIADVTGLPLATTIRFIERRSAGAIGPLQAAHVASQQQVADAFATLGLIPHPIRVADAVWKA